MRPAVVVAGRPFDPWFPRAALAEGLVGLLRTEGEQIVAPAPGVFAVGGRLGVVLPRCYGVSREEPDLLDDVTRIGAAARIIRVLARYLRDLRKQSSVEKNELELAVTTVGAAEDLLERLDAAMSLIADWQKNGPLAIATRQIRPRLAGRIHWPRTIATTPQLVSGPSILHPEPVRTRHAIDPEHSFTELHAATCEAAGRWLGWTERRAVQPAISAREALGLLDRTERSLFQDRQREVARLLRRYYAPSGQPEGRPSERVAGVFARSFPHVWERMLIAALGPAERPLLPGGRYRLAGHDKGVHGTSFRIDLLIAAAWRGQPVEVILDAKDYEPGRWPQGEAVNKQILYRHLRSERYRPGRLPIERIGNAFVGPALVSGSGVMCRAVHDLDGEQGEPAPLGRIVCLEVDFERVADAYVRGRPDLMLRQAAVDTVMDKMCAAEDPRVSEVRVATEGRSLT